MAITPNGTACRRTRTSRTGVRFWKNIVRPLGALAIAGAFFSMVGHYLLLRAKEAEGRCGDAEGRRTPMRRNGGCRAERDGRPGDGARSQDRGHRGGRRDRPRTPLGARGALVRGPDVLHLLAHRVAHLDALTSVSWPASSAGCTPAACSTLGGSRVRGCLDTHVRAMGSQMRLTPADREFITPRGMFEVLPVPQRGQRRRQVQRRPEDAVLGGGEREPWACS